MALNLPSQTHSSTITKRGAVSSALLVLLMSAKVQGQIVLQGNSQLKMQNTSVYTPGISVDSGAIQGKGDIHVYTGNFANNTSGSVFANTDSVQVYMDGTTTQTVGGTNPTNFYQFHINNGAGVHLMQNQDVRDKLQFLQGLLELNGYTIDLGTTGKLENESENSRTTDITNGGTVKATRNLNAPVAADDANLRLKITSPDNLGSTTITRGHTQKNLGSDVSIYLRYTIDPASAPTDSVTEKIHYFDGELAPGVGSESDLDIRKNNTSVRQRQYGVPSPIDNTVTATSAGFGDTITVGGTTGIPLAVELTEFQATCDNGNIPHLRWKTATETNSSHFLIRRSKDALHRDPIGQLPSSGNSTQVHSYEFIDTAANSGTNSLGVTYYRLDEIDNDGDTSRSQVIASDCDGGGNIGSMIIFPNPVADGRITVQIQSNAYKQTPLSIYNAQGQLVLQQQIQSVNGISQYFIDVSMLAAGVYHINIEGRTVKCVVAR